MVPVTPSPDRAATGLPSSPASPPSPTSGVGGDGHDRPDAGSSSAVRSAVGRLRREHARLAWPARTSTASWLARSPAASGAAPAASAPDGRQADPLVGLLATLRAVTTRYVCRMRAEGARPEQMLVRVKACVRDAMTAEGWEDPEAVQAVTAAVVTWSIAAYYDR